jgi:hypothetical protein
MVTLAGERLSTTDPTDEQFVDAVIRVHERIQSGLEVLALGVVSPAIEDAVEGADTDVIRAYCLSYGVEPRERTGARRRNAPRWIAV